MYPSTPPGGGAWPDGPQPGQPGARPAGGRPPATGSARAIAGAPVSGAARAFGPPGDGYPGDPPTGTDEEADGRRDRASARRSARRRGGVDRPPSATPRGGDDSEPADEAEPVPVAPVRRDLSLAIAGFAALLGVGLILGAQTSGPGTRGPYAIVIFGVQLLFILAWTMAMRPPAARTVAGVCVVVAVVADLGAVLPLTATIAPLGYAAAGGFVLALLGQLIRRADRARVTDSLGTTLLIVVGVVAFATLIVLTRKPIGTQAVLVCLAAVAVSLVVARLTDIVFPRPRMAAQVPRGATGVVLGAMLGTLASALLGIYLIGFTPTSAAVVGLVAAVGAGLADLGANYAEAGRLMAGGPPTFWIARHMQGPLGGFALAAPGAYAMAVLYLT